MDQSYINKRIEQLKGFVPTTEHPSPSRLPGGKIIDDVLAVAAGSKPIGFVGQYFGMPYRNIITALEKAGVTVKTQRYWLGNDWTYDLIAARNPKDISKMDEIFINRHKMQLPEYHTKLGRLLGYPEQAINHFIAQNKDQAPFKNSGIMYKKAVSWGDFVKTTEGCERLISRHPIAAGVPIAALGLASGSYLAWKGGKSFFSRSDEATDQPGNKLVGLVSVVAGISLAGLGIWTASIAKNGSIKQCLR